MTRSIGAALAAYMLCASPAAALTIVNQDSEEHTITVITETDQLDQLLASGDKMDAACEPGCTVLMDEEEEGIEAAGSETLVIRDGVLVR